MSISKMFSFLQSTYGLFTTEAIAGISFVNRHRTTERVLIPILVMQYLILFGIFSTIPLPLNLVMSYEAFLGNRFICL